MLICGVRIGCILGFAAHLSGVWIGLLVAGCLTTVGVAARLGGLLTEAQEWVVAEPDASSEPRPVDA
jgi:hypothetical protein